MSEKKESPWKATRTPNLVRYEPKGTYYLRGRFGGTPVRECLHTTSESTAKVKLHERLAELRANRPCRNTDIQTLPDALSIVRAKVANDPALKASSRATYFDWLDDLTASGPAAVPGGPLARLSESDLEQWWSRAAGSYAPSRANKLFMLVRRAMAIARKAGAIGRDLTENLKWLDVPPTNLQLITLEQFQVLVADIRARSSEAADWVEFMTFCGLRPGEVESLQWEHLDEKTGRIAVHGAVEGPKNRRVRHVPMVPAMIELVTQMRGSALRAGKVFSIQRPKTTLARACKRLGLPPMRVYDLRHLFATICAQSGTDIPTLSRWLGHSDGGALAMRTYIHTGQDHERAAASRVRF